MNPRSMIPMGLAVAIGLIAMVFTRQMLTSDGGKKEEETQDILVAVRDLKVEEVLKADLVKVVKMARSAVPAYSFSRFKDIEDRWVKTPMLEGDVLVEKKLGPKGTPPGLVANIPPGMRAFAIDVTEQSGVSGFVLPGHHVDVIRFEQAERERTDLRGETILQDVLVLAAGQIFSRPEERSVTSHTVTLALKPDDVDTLVAARSKGPLSLALRGVNDHDQVSRPKPKPAVDPEHEKRWKLAEEKRAQVEQELELLKQSLAKKATPPPAPMRRSPRIATIYRGLQNSQRVRIDAPAMTELELEQETGAIEEADSRTRAGSSSTQVAAADGRTAP
jgi:pilus assembly protein CpaB